VKFFLVNWKILQKKQFVRAKREQRRRDKPNCLRQKRTKKIEQIILIIQMNLRAKSVDRIV
jgi:hypothetical protein